MSPEKEVELPGLFGLLGTSDSQRLAVMTAILNHNRYKEDSCVLSRAVVGRLHLGTFFPDVQPVWHPTKKYAIMADGHIVVDRDISDCMNRSTATLQRLLEWYLEEGDSFLRHIRTGIFNLMIIDLEHGLVKIINDRLGLLPLYHGITASGELCFAPEEKALVQTGILPKVVDWTGVAEYLYFHYCIGSRTFYKNVRLMEPGTVMTFDLERKELTSRGYYRIAYSPNHHLTLPASAEIAYEKLVQACTRLSVPQLDYALLLSGGLDSRLILSAWSDKSTMHAWTYGQEGCLDMRTAIEVAQVANVPHLFIPFDQNTLVDTHEEAVWTLEHLRHAWAIVAYRAIQKDGYPLAINGFDGNAFLGDTYCPSPVYRFLPSGTLPTLSAWLARGKLKQIRLIHPRELRAQLSDEVWSRLDTASREVLDDVMTEMVVCSRGASNGRDELEAFNVRNLSRRGIGPQCLRQRFHLEFLCPFSDYDLLEFSRSIPVKHRAGDQIRPQMLARKAPEYSRLGSAAAPPSTSRTVAKVPPLNRVRSKKIRFTEQRALPVTSQASEIINVDRWYKQCGSFANLLEHILLESSDVVSIANMKFLLDQARRDVLNPEDWQKILRLASVALWWEHWGKS